MLGGRLRIAGVVLGRVYGLNGDVALAEGSRIDGTVTVLGGALDAADRLPVSGDVRVWRSRFRYKESGDSLIVEPEREVVSRWPSLSAIDDRGAHAELFLTSGHTYNRVEGLSLYGGPRFGVTNGDTRFNVELFGVFRTGNRLRWERENLGHRVFAQLQRGTHAGVRVGGRLFDVVDAVEQWQLSPTKWACRALSSRVTTATTGSDMALRSMRQSLQAKERSCVQSSARSGGRLDACATYGHFSAAMSRGV